MLNRPHFSFDACWVHPTSYEPDLFQRPAFFDGITIDQSVALSTLAREETAPTGHYFFREGDVPRTVFLVLTGHVDLTVGIPDRSREQLVVELLMGNFLSKSSTVDSVRPGEIFGWSSLIPPHVSTASAQATAPCRLIAFDGQRLLQLFEQDAQLGHLLLRRVTGEVQKRIHETTLRASALMPTGPGQFTG